MIPNRNQAPLNSNNRKIKTKIPKFIGVKPKNTQIINKPINNFGDESTNNYCSDRDSSESENDKDSVSNNDSINNSTNNLSESNSENGSINDLGDELNDSEKEIITEKIISNDFEKTFIRSRHRSLSPKKLVRFKKDKIGFFVESELYVVAIPKRYVNYLIVIILSFIISYFYSNYFK